MHLLSDWRTISRRAWSMRLIALSVLLSGAEVAIPYLDGVLPIPRGTFAALAGVVSVSAAVARLLAQGRTGDDAE